MRLSAHHQARSGPPRTGAPPLIAPSLRGYRRAWLSLDLAAAMTLLAIALPEQMAITRLAGMPALTGVYAFVVASVAFALFGSNPRMSVGADSTIAPLIAVGVAGVAASGSVRYQQLVSLLAVLVGLIVALVGLLRLGWISLLLSTPIIAGFLTGVAVIITVHQLPDLLGLSPPTGSTVARIGSMAGRLGDVNGWSLTIGLAVLAFIVGCEAVSRRLPGALIAMVVSTALVAGLGWTTHGVAVLGPIPRTGPHLGLSGLSVGTLGRLLPLAAVVALVVVIQSAATTQAFGADGSADGAAAGAASSGTDRDFMGVGLGSVAAGLVGAYAVNASPPRTAAVVESGGRTQLASLVAAAVMAALIPAAGLLEHLPLTTLAAILLFIASRILPVRDLRAIARFSRLELGLAVLTMLTVALVGVEQGVVVATVLAILDRARQDARPQLHVLGQVPGTTSFTPVSGPEPTAQVPGVLVVLFATPLWYANARHFRAEMHDALGRASGPIRFVVLDALGMHSVDFTGARALSAVIDEFEARGLHLAVARAGTGLRSSLDRAGITARLGADHFYATVGEATVALSPGS